MLPDDILITNKPIACITSQNNNRTYLHLVNNYDTMVYQRLEEEKEKTAVNLKLTYDPTDKACSLCKITPTIVLFTVKKHQRVILPFNIKCNIPDLIFVLKNWTTPNIHMYVFITNIKTNKAGEKQYDSTRAWPYGNVYNNGSVCLGSTELPSIKTFITQSPDDMSILNMNVLMSIFATSFLSSDFNNDLQFEPFDNIKAE